MAGVAGVEKLAGIYRYVGGHQQWSITLVRTFDELTADAIRAAIGNGTDGFIISIPGARDAAHVLADSDIPTAVMDIHDDALAKRPSNIVFIRNDSSAIGHTAARHLISQGVYRSYAVVHDRNMMTWSLGRAAAFRRHLADMGIRVAEFDGTKSDMEIVRRLVKLPAPCGVFATHDDRAQSILETCRAASIHVPSKVAVLGVDNDTFLCEHTIPPLSSIQPDFEKEGFLAAQFLDEMMASHSATKAQTITCGVKAIISRQTTTPSSIAGHLVQRALAFIDRHACEGISVKDVARHLQVSRSLADRRFRELQNTSINAAIVERQLSEVRKMLITTCDPIESITRSCGWESPNYPKRLFKNRYRMTMRDFRKLNRRSTPST